MFKNFFANEEGQGMVEYGLIIALIAVVVIVALTTLGEKVGDVFNGASDKLEEVVPTAAGEDSK